MKRNRRSLPIAAALGLGLCLAIAPAWAAPEAEAGHAELFQPGEIVVKYKSGAQPGRRSPAWHSASGPSVRRHARRIERLRVQEGFEVPEALAQLRASADVEYAEPNWTRFPRLLPDDPRLNRLWGLHNTGQTLDYADSDDPVTGVAGADMALAAAWDLHTDAGDVVIALVDNGVLLDHPDLKNNIWTNPGEIAGNGIDDDGNGYVDDVHGWDFRGNDNDPSPSSEANGSHGTMVAGAAGAIGNNGRGVTGPAWRVKLMPLRIDFTIATITEALDYAAANGAHIVNASFGGGAYSQAEFEAVADLRDAGVLFIAAAGNDGYSNDEIPDSPSGLDLPNILAVGASHPAEGPSLFTQIGPTTVDVAAPGSSIYTTKTIDGEPGYGFAEGTSFSTPYTAGAAALIKAYRESAHGETLDYQALKGRIMAGVDRNNRFRQRFASEGRVNVHQAMTVAEQPVLVIASLDIDDSRDGNGNGALDPAEKVAFSIELDNVWADATGVSALLTSLDPAVTVLTDTSAYPDIPSGRSRSGTPFKLRIAQGTDPFRRLPMRLTLTADNYQVSRYFSLPFGALTAVNGKVEQVGVFRAGKDYWDNIHVYHVELPAGVSSAVFDTGSSSADIDVDLVVRPGKATELTNCYWVEFDNCQDADAHYSVGSTSTEIVTLTTPPAGTYFVTLIGLPKADTATDLPYQLSVTVTGGISEGGGGGGGGVGWLGLGVLLAYNFKRRRQR